MPVTLTIGMNLVMLALVAYAAHARLAAERPPTEHLTGFYLVVATGGALGGLLNGLVAPMVFDRVLEYSLALMVVPLLLVGIRGGRDSWLARQVDTNRVRAVAVCIVVVLLPLGLRLALQATATDLVQSVPLIALTAVLGWWISHLPKAMVAALVVFFVLAAIGETQGVLERGRTFFGSYTVTDQRGMNQLVHGTTTHGTQFQEPSRRGTPTTYYSRGGPLGDVFAGQTRKNVALVGLGTGTVAAYGQAGQRMTFFEIDPEVVRIARDPKLFTYLADSDATIDTVVGDGRLGVAKAGTGSFDMIVLDAFSSDSIPVHLLTEEAMRTYVDRLAPNGLLVVHISNRVFDLEPVLASAAERLGLSAVTRYGGGGVGGATPSHWVALGRNASDVVRLAALPGWRDLGARQVHWTDDYSSILSVLQ